MPQPTKLGLVLSGGGAKGAYQAGVLRYLAEMNIQPDAVAGASIGSLNGAVVANAENVKQAADSLEVVWREIAEKSPLKMDPLAFVAILLKICVAAFGGAPGRVFAMSAHQLEKIVPVKYHKYVSDPAFFDNSPTIDILTRYAGLENDSVGLPFWVSVYESEGAIKDLVGTLRATVGISDSKGSMFLPMHLLSSEDKRKALLASSAIPLAFEAQLISGKKYYDGGLGGWNTAQGNTPVTPLIVNEKCSHVIVTHLDDGSFWNRNSFPGTTFLEIRPKKISRNGLKDMLNFEKSTLLEWMEQGYHDTSACIGSVKGGLDVFSKSQASHASLEKSLGDMADSLQWMKR
ncbi:patatin-like phospholipase family protein [Halomonas chromatireducens]|uniref:PNPLA domain-containing protein n=1 Tax=Halomonas chromatireducens TaxID=507626 RepID=A0A109ULE1_9GAMM|nr:patatin-like phospholipase family protein [Halomonas chromatireducens]AMD00394.1 hypothetical protein LOKO_01326 [Halomonas chromatireducens]